MKEINYNKLVMFKKGEIEKVVKNIENIENTN